MQWLRKIFPPVTEMAPREPYNPHKLLTCNRCGSALYIDDIQAAAKDSLFVMSMKGMALPYHCQNKDCMIKNADHWDQYGQVITGDVSYCVRYVPSILIEVEGTFESDAVRMLGELLKLGVSKEDAPAEWKSRWQALVSAQLESSLR